MTTTDSALESFVEIPAHSDFPIQNLPYGVFKRSDGQTHVGMAIGEYALDLAVLHDRGVLNIPSLQDSRPFHRSSLNAFMAMGRSTWQAVRERASQLLRASEATLRDDDTLREQALLPHENIQMLLPADIGDYTDFYSSKEHATNVGTIFRGKENALKPNWTWLPVGYHGRSSSIIVDGTDVRRPRGQQKPDDDAPPVFGPSRLLDFELEMGFLTGPGNDLGTSISVADAEEHIFGMVIVNDWSARDIQGWEYVPLGPFLGKSFATTISPWVVPLAALEPFRCTGPKPEHPPPAYLKQEAPHAFDLHLEVGLQSETMETLHPICRSNFRYLYWSMAQQLAHHTVNGCNLRPGDLLASGTISGPTPDSYGSLLELTWRGTEPLTLPDGREHTFLEDGDRVSMTAWGEGDNYRVGFGEASGRVLPAVDA